MTDGAVARLTDRRILALRGEDVGGFLQGLITVDMHQLSPSQSLWGALLTPQGRYLFDFFVLCGDLGEVLLDCEAARAGALLQRLQLYRLRRKIEITDTGDAFAVLVSDADPARFGLAPERGATVRVGQAIVLVDPRLAALGLRSVLPAASVVPFIAEHGLREVPAEVFVRRRLRLGVPEGSADLVPERSLPLECNFPEFGGVSFNKGCFVGQEVTARMHFRARPRRRLLPARFIGPAPAAGTPVRTADGEEAGTVQRVLDELGLVLIRVEHLWRLEARPLLADGTTVEPELPAWLALQEKNPLQPDPDEA